MSSFKRINFKIHSESQVSNAQHISITSFLGYKETSGIPMKMATSTRELMKVCIRSSMSKQYISETTMPMNAFFWVYVIFSKRKSSSFHAKNVLSY